MTKALAAALICAALVVPASASAFDNTEPLASQQWYLTLDRAWAYWPTVPALYPIKVAVIDSGIDGTHPDLVGRVVAAKSFVGSSPFHDEDGHGTFVAGEIAANPFNKLGIAGLAFNAQLLIAKVVGADGSVSLAAEVAAIRWAADNGARVINLSLGGVRDPLDHSLDTYSPLEAAAIEYAYSKGAVVVAAIGNGPQSPATPWNFADYPAALPHTIGVSAVRRNGSVPAYSNRDAVYNDLAAPGDGIFSTIPQQLVQPGPVCQNHPYSDCSGYEFRDAIGTSFAAPQVSAAAALVLGQSPTLRPDQVAWLLERSADDANSSTGCGVCAPGRDAFTGWGTLDVENALTMLTDGTAIPPPDQDEPNDDAGPWAHPLAMSARTLSASLDYWDDNIDVYRIHLAKGSRLFARVTSPAANVRLTLWRPGTQHVDGLAVDSSARLAQSHRVGTQSRLSFRVPRAGDYYLELKLDIGLIDPVQYRLALARG